MPDYQEWVEMTHSELGKDSTGPDGGPARVTREAFDEVWKDKGWTLVTKSTSPKSSSTAATTGGK